MYKVFPVALAHHITQIDTEEKSTMNPIGITLILTATLIPLYWYLPHTKQHDTLAVISQYLGSVSLILMGIVQFMATRARGIEAIFGGLDRIYVLHKWLAVIAILFAALHDTIDADMSGLGAETFLTDVAETFGELGFYGILWHFNLRADYYY